MAVIANPDVLNDGAVIPVEGFGAFAAGRYPNKIPIILGGNREELKTILDSSKDDPLAGTSSTRPW